MRRIIYFLATALAMLVVSIKIASAQGSVGVNTKTPNVNAALDITSLGKQGILIPRLSAEDTLVAPLKSSSLSAKDKGLLFYDTVGLQFLHWNGLRWQAFGKNSEGVGPQGPIGLTGAAGPVGPQGPIGLTGPQGPAGNDGAVGATGPQGPIGLTGAVGPVGSQGPIGLTGLNGKTVLNGILDPVAATGDDGDFYINTATNKIFGPKTLGVWAAGVSLIGPAGSFSVTGTIGQTIYHDGTAWKATSNLYNDGTSVGIGTPAVSANKLLIRSANSGTIPFAVQNSTNTNALIEVGDFAGSGLFRGFASSGPTIGFSFNANQTNNSFLLGNFGVGINSPSEKLTVNGNAIILEGNSLKFAEPVGANFTAFKAGNQTADITYTLPSTQGAAGNVLVTDNLGNLSWSSISGLSGGTTNYVPKWASANTLSSTSLLYDNGIGVAIGSNNPFGAILRVNGDEIIFDNNPTGIEITSATSIGSGFAQMVYDASTGATGSPSMSYIFKPRNNSNSGTNTYAEMKFVKVANQDYGFVAFSTLNAASNYAERMRLDAEGRLGIGKSPTQALDVLGNVRFSGALMPNNTAGTSGQVLVSAGTGNVPTWANITGTIVGGVADQTFRHNGATWVASSLLTNDGTYIGIGSNASTAKLNIAPESGLGHAISMYQNGSTTNYWYEGVRMSDGNKYHGYNGLFRGLYSSVDGVYLSASDNKLKKNVNNLDKTLGSVSKLRPVKYHMNEQKDTDMQRIGFIAQEVKEYFPELVEYDESENIHSLNYGSMSVIAIKAIQEQQKIIEGLQTQIEVLQQQVNSLLFK